MTPEALGIALSDGTVIPFDRLANITTLAEMLGVSRIAAQSWWVRREGNENPFPPPLVVLEVGRSRVNLWNKDTFPLDYRPGRGRWPKVDA